MNGKRAKQLRGMARGKTAGLPDRKPMWMEITTTVGGVRSRHHEIRHKDCTRALYQEYKKDYKKSMRAA